MNEIAILRAQWLEHRNDFEASLATASAEEIARRGRLVAWARREYRTARNRVYEQTRRKVQ